MAQVIIPNGLAIGAPGPAGSPMVYIFADNGNPNTRTDSLSLMANCSLGSTYMQIDSPAFWQKTGAASVSNPSGVWTAIS